MIEVLERIRFLLMPHFLQEERTDQNRFNQGHDGQARRFPTRQISSYHGSLPDRNAVWPYDRHDDRDNHNKRYSRYC